MLTVYARHSSKCPKKDNPTWRRCRCWKWITGSLPGRLGSMRVSAKTRSWEQAESLARKYEIAAVGGEEVKEARTLPTLKEAVNGYLADAKARGLASATIQKLEHIFKKQLLSFADQHRIVFLRRRECPQHDGVALDLERQAFGEEEKVRTGRRLLLVLRAPRLDQRQSHGDDGPRGRQTRSDGLFPRTRIPSHHLRYVSSRGGRRTLLGS
jgi:hypothetical protein